MPANIIIFERCAYASIALLMVADLIAHLGLHNGFWELITIWLIWEAARNRKNWARWAYTDLMALIALGTAWLACTGQYRSLFATAPVSRSLQLLALIPAVAAIYFVFAADAKPWFLRPDNGRATRE